MAPMTQKKFFELQFMEVTFAAPRNSTFRRMASVVDSLSNALFEYRNGNLEKAEAHLKVAAKLGKVLTLETWKGYLLWYKDYSAMEE